MAQQALTRQQRPTGLPTKSFYYSTKIRKFEAVNGPVSEKIILSLLAAACLSFWGVRDAVAQKSTGLTRAGRVLLTPDTINFGRVKVGKDGSAQFLLSNTDSTGPFTILPATRILDSLASTDFHTLDFAPDQIVQQKQTLPVQIYFRPKSAGRQRAEIRIYTTDPLAQGLKAPRLILFGRGIQASLSTTGYDFGAVRVDSLSEPGQFVISNVGSDSARITSVSFVSGSMSDFSFVSKDLPTFARPQILDTLGSTMADHIYIVQFRPTSEGKKFVVVMAQGLDGLLRYDTLRGEGVEPTFAAAPHLLDFGEIVVGTGPVKRLDSLFFTITNSGSTAGRLDSITHSANRDLFRIYLNNSDSTRNIELPMSRTWPGIAEFSVVRTGLFVDTIRFFNNSRNQPSGSDTMNRPILILKAKVTTNGGQASDTISLGDIETCLAIDTVINVRNKSSIQISFDTILFRGDTAGFSLFGTPFQFPINISSDSSYPIPIRYRFPRDSATGRQTFILLLIQRPIGDDPPDTLRVVIALARNLRKLLVTTEKPSFAPSAGDYSPFRLPIRIKGEKAGVDELNNFDLRLIFSNDLFKPVGIDRTGSVTENGPGNDSTTSSALWDEASHTYTISVHHAPVSSGRLAKNDLLLTVLVRSFITGDTSSMLTPILDVKDKICGYTLAQQNLELNYANDCADLTIRKKLLGGPILISDLVAWPNPTTSAALRAHFVLGQAANLEWKIITEAGTLACSGSRAATKGKNYLPLPLLPSGQYTLLLTARTSNGAQTSAAKFTTIR